MPSILLNRWVQLLAGTALALVLGFGLGHHQKTLEDASAALKSARAATGEVSRQASVNSTVDQHATAQLGAVHEVTKTIIQRIPVYVTPKADAQCVVSNGAVQLLDAAGSGTVPAAPVGLPDGDSGVALSQLVADNGINADSYRQAVIKGQSWDEWYDAQNPAWRAAHRRP